MIGQQEAARLASGLNITTQSWPVYHNPPLHWCCRCRMMLPVLCAISDSTLFDGGLLNLYHWRPASLLPILYWFAPGAGKTSWTSEPPFRSRACAVLTSGPPTWTNCFPSTAQISTSYSTGYSSALLAIHHIGLSPTCLYCRKCERVVTRQLMAFLERNNLAFENLVSTIWLSTWSLDGDGRALSAVRYPRRC